MTAGYTAVFRLPRGDFEVFRPEEATHCTDGVKFGVEESPSVAKFHPVGAGVEAWTTKL